MGSNYKDIDAKCPFYLGFEKSHKWATISCEGIDDSNKTTIKLQFCKQEDGQTFKEVRCDSNYFDCPISKMLEAKYE